MKTKFQFLALMLSACLSALAQVTTEPSPLQENSEGIVIYFHADQGNKQLAGLSSSAQIYAHTGVITSTSSNDSDWKYATDWNKNEPKYKMEYVSPDLWQLKIGDIRSFYGITDSSVAIRKLAFVFRTADYQKEGKGPNNSDIMVPVYQAGLHISLTSSLPGAVITPTTGEVKFSAASTRMGNISIFVGDTRIGYAENTTSLEAGYTFPQQGDYQIRALVQAGSETAESSLRLCYPGDAVAKDYPGGTPEMGAVRNGNKVVFCIAAPNKKNAILVGSWNDYAITSSAMMNYQDFNGVRYFWTELDLDPDTRYLYYYYIDGIYQVGDPYARLVLDRANDGYIPDNVFPDMPAYPVDKVKDVPLAVLREASADKYDWKVKDFKGADKSDLIIYELLLRDFTGTCGQAKGDGTVRSAMERLDYLKSLGVNAVELMPINEFNGNISWGYNPNFYFAPDKAYGTPEDYKAFIDACHERGIAVILDMVLNHSDWQHPWYQMYEKGDNPFFNATAPHAFSVFNDWKQEYPLVQKQWKDMLKYWLEEYNVDGFRFDLVKGLGDSNSYANNSSDATSAYNSSRVARMKDLQQAVEAVKPGAYFINESLALAKEENEMAASGQLNWANINNQGCQYAMGYSSDSGLDIMYAPNNGNRTWGSTVSYLESHDEQRLAYKQQQWGVAGVKGNIPNAMRRLGCAAAQMILTPGAHMIWQFSEMGNEQTTKNSNGDNNTDPKTVCWDLLDNPDRLGLVSTYSALIRLRNLNKDMFAQDAEFITNCASGNWSLGRTMISRKGGKEIITVINPNVSGNDLSVNVAFASNDNSRYSIAAKSYGTSPSFDAASGKVTVPVNSFVSIISEGVTGVRSVDSGFETGLSVSSSKGSIYISNSFGSGEIYSVSGMKTASFGAGETVVDVVPGLYIVRTGDKIRKVIVK